MRNLALVLLLSGCAADLDPGVGDVTAATSTAPVQVSFDIIDKGDLYTWNAVRALADADLGPMITSQNRPADLPASRWAKNISPSYWATGDQMAAAIAGLLSSPTDAPARVMIDELRPEFETRIVDCARRLRAEHPEWRGRWGAYVVNGNGVAYPNMSAGIDALLEAGAIVAAEMYARQSEYCAAGATAGERDGWLGDFFHGDRGEFAQGRFHWLMQRKVYRRSTSPITVLFGVTDAFMDGPAPALFLDRMFYVWASRSGYPYLLSTQMGGIGAWKWDAPSVQQHQS